MNNEIESGLHMMEVIPHDKQRASALKDLKGVMASDGGIYASADELFRDSKFGRDSAESGEDLLRSHPEVTKSIIISLAELQGSTYNPDTEEEPGRIHHEFRELYVQGRKVSEGSENIINNLASKKWGTPEKIHYFGTIDASPLYVRLVMDYVARNGKDSLDREFLDQEITKKNGEKITIRDSVTQGLSWIENRMQQSSLGLVEFKRTNPQGVENQVWKDSDTSYVHTDGTIANHDAPIAPIEVQGYAYDAFMKAREILGTEEDKERWERNALHLQSSLDQMWVPEEQFFAMGIDRDAEGKPRLIETTSTNSALLLDTDIFDTIPEPKKSIYIQSIVKKITSDSFLTDVGIRTRDVKYAELISHKTDPDKYLSDYHGSETSWIKETYDISKGLHRQGFHKLAEQLENRILNAVTISGKFYEFYYVDKEGEVNYRPVDTSESTDARKKLLVTNIPEGSQAWTIAAVLDIKHKRGENISYETSKNSPTSQLEESILQTIPIVDVITHMHEVLPPEPSFAIERIQQVA